MGAALKRLDVFFGGRRVVAITTVLVTDYPRQRQTEGAANGTINRELAVLVRMLRLAYEHAAPGDPAPPRGLAEARIL